MNIDIPAESLITPAFEAALSRSLERVLPSVVAKLVEAKQEKLLVNADPAAELLSMSRRTLDALVAKGEIPVVRLTSRPQFRPETLRQYLAEKEK